MLGEQPVDARLLDALGDLGRFLHVADTFRQAERRGDGVEAGDGEKGATPAVDRQAGDPSPSAMVATPKESAVWTRKA